MLSYKLIGRTQNAKRLKSLLYVVSSIIIVSYGKLCLHDPILNFMWIITAFAAARGYCWMVQLFDALVNMHITS
jgi:hypothetical protein